MTPQVVEKEIPIQLVPVQVVRKLEQNRDSLLQQAQAHPVNNQNDSDVANIMLKKLAAAAKVIKDKFDSVLRPQNEAIKQLRSLRDQILVPIEETKRELSQRLLEWRANEVRKIAEETARVEVEEQRRRKIQEAHAAKGHEVAAPARVERPLPLSALDTTRVRRTWDYDIVDEALIPREYLMIDRGAVRDAINAGVREISGLKIYQQSSVVCA